MRDDREPVSEISDDFSSRRFFIIIMADAYTDTLLLSGAVQNGYAFSPM